MDNPKSDCYQQYNMQARWHSAINLGGCAKFVGEWLGGPLQLSVARQSNTIVIAKTRGRLLFTSYSNFKQIRENKKSTTPKHMQVARNVLPPVLRVVVLSTCEVNGAS